VWESRREAAIRRGKEAPPYTEKPVSHATKSQYLSFMGSLLKTAANDWGWIKAAPVIKTKKADQQTHPLVDQRRGRAAFRLHARVDKAGCDICSGNRPSLLQHHCSGVAAGRYAEKGCMGKSGEREGRQGYRRGSE
jgi:hypothetical protein